MKYRKITELTDDEIKFIVDKICKPEKICRIIRYKRKQEVVVKIKTEWHSEDENGKDEITYDTEYVTLTDPFIKDGYEPDSNTYDFRYWDNQNEFKKFCLAKGVCEYLKDNEYLEK